MALASWRRTIFEDVSEMTIAKGTKDLNARHTMTAVNECHDIFHSYGLEKTGPARTRIKFSVGGKKREVATGTVINARFFVI